MTQEHDPVITFMADIALGEWQTVNMTAGEHVKLMIADPHKHGTMAQFFPQGMLQSSKEVFKDYTLIGTAQIRIMFADPDTLVANEIAALQESLRKERIKAELAQKAILDRISKLQALTMEQK